MKEPIALTFGKPESAPSVIPGMMLEGIMQSSGHALQICGPETGHTVRDIAFFSDEYRADSVARALRAHNDLLGALKALHGRLAASHFMWPEVEAARVAILKADGAKAKP